MSAINSEKIKARQQKLGQALADAGLDAIVLNPGPSLNYMTGLEFHLSERPVVCFFRQSGAPVLVLPELESAKALDLPYDLEYFTYPEEPTEWVLAFKKAAQAAGLSGAQVGVEDRVMRFLELEFLKAALPESEFVNAVDTVAQLRMYKDESEVAAMQKAVDIAQAALEATLKNVKVGMTEKELGAELVMQIFQRGSGTKLPFMPIVASGPNSANPHYFGGERKLTPGDLLVIDWGASMDGYYSDLTRTFAIGEPNEEQKKIHQAVLDANLAAQAASKPGVPCSDVDKAARDVIDGAGYGKYFTHRTGHGLGMEGHEEPYMRAGNPMLLEPGMTYTIEPGIYITGQDGVRIEDNVVVTADGLRSLSTMERGLRVISE